MNAQNQKPKGRERISIGVWGLGIHSDFWFLVSGFGIASFP
jgi:hypothetical protein